MFQREIATVSSNQNDLRMYVHTQTHTDQTPTTDTVLLWFASSGLCRGLTGSPVAGGNSPIAFPRGGGEGRAARLPIDLPTTHRFCIGFGDDVVGFCDILRR